MLRMITLRMMRWRVIMLRLMRWRLKMLGKVRWRMMKSKMLLPRPTRFVRACAVEMHMDISDISHEPLYADIDREYAGAQSEHLDQTPALTLPQEPLSVDTLFREYGVWGHHLPSCHQLHKFGPPSCATAAPPRTESDCLCPQPGGAPPDQTPTNTQHAPSSAISFTIISGRCFTLDQVNSAQSPPPQLVISSWPVFFHRSLGLPLRIGNNWLCRFDRTNLVHYRPGSSCHSLAVHTLSIFLSIFRFSSDSCCDQWIHYRYVGHRDEAGFTLVSMFRKVSVQNFQCFFL